MKTIGCVVYKCARCGKEVDWVDDYGYCDECLKDLERPFYFIY